MLTYKHKLILSKAQQDRIDSWIGVCRLVYNMGLNIKIDAWKSKQVNVSAYDLMKQLPDIKDYDWIADVPAQSLQNSLERLDKAYKSFFSGGGFPKYKSKKTYKSILFKSASLSTENKLKLPKIGEVKFFKEKQQIQGVIKTVQIIQEPSGYFVCIVCDGVSKTIGNTNESQVIGLDMGVTYFCVDSNGSFIENPKHFRHYEDKLKEEQRILANKVKFNNGWKKQARKIGLLHQKIANLRKDFLHKESTKLASKYHTVIIEDLKIKNMTKRAKTKQDEDGKFLPNGQSAKSGLNKSILDCGWGMFKDMLEYKTNVFRINPKYTSQTCNECGCVDSKNRLSQSEFLCKKCGHISNADVNAAKNILSKGIALIEIRRNSCVGQ